MKLFKRFLTVAALAAQLGALQAAAPTTWTAAVEESDGVLRSYGFPSRIVEVRFPRAFPTNIVKSIVNYTLFRSEKPGEAIPIQAVRLGGNLHGGGVTNVSIALLLPTIELPVPDPRTAYLVRVNFGGESSGDVVVVWPEEAAPEPIPPSSSELINLISVSSNLLFGPLHATLDARIPADGSHAPAFDLAVKYDVFDQPLRKADDSNFDRMWLGAIHFTGDATYKLDNSDTNISDHISASANFDLLYLYRLGNPLTRVDSATGKRQGKLAYFAGVRLTGFELESDQDFEVVNWAMQPQVAVWVPYSNIPALWWSRRIGITGNAASPVFLYAGYSIVNSLRTDPIEVSEAVQEANRFELEVAYAFPVTSRLRLGVRSRFFWLEGGMNQDYQELFARYYLDKTSTTALLFKYTRGALPPKFQEGESVGGGLSLEF